MKYAIVYSSRTGNTKMLAEQIKEILPAEELVYYGGPDEAALSAERIYTGFWTDKGAADEKTLSFLKTAENKEIVLFGTAGFGTDSTYFDGLLGKTRNVVPESSKVLSGFMCQGKMPASVRKRYEGMLEEKKDDKMLAQLIKNFDRALSHPDSNDLARLEKFVLGLEQQGIPGSGPL